MAKIQEYKCPNCGGAITFDSSLQKMKCPYCDTELDVESLLAYDKDLASASKEDKINWEKPGRVWQEGDEEGMRVYVCNSCGGEIIGDENTAATACPFCGNPVVLMGQVAGTLMPDYIIPFKLDKEAAKKKLLEHYKDKPFIPDTFTDKNHIDEIKGIYVPYWLFDTDARGIVRYKGSKIRTWRDSQNVYTETSYYSVVRQGTITFENIPADGSTKMPDDLMESIEPYDFSEAVDFQTAYMSGYLADKYDVPAGSVIPTINARVKASVESAFAKTAPGYSTLTTEDSTVSSVDGNAVYAMYPVWLLNTTWNGEKYTFAMNGQTGKMVGDIPIDKKKERRQFFKIGGIFGAAAFLIFAALQLL